MTSYLVTTLLQLAASTHEILLWLVLLGQCSCIMPGDVIALAPDLNYPHLKQMQASQENQ